MKTIHVQARKPYDVLIGHGLLEHAGEILSRLAEPCRIALVSDDRVYTLYGEATAKALRKYGFEVHPFVFAQGEASKSMETVSALLSFLVEKKLTRTDLVVALGGGVTGDLAGFAAAIYLRGIRYVQIPTTLLAAVDSSVGGKTAVNLAGGKNLAGAFWQPLLVLCDCDTFRTLSEEVFSGGVAESLKYGVICDRPLFDEIAQGGFAENCAGIVERCVSIKAAIVAEDEFDQGTRQLLNFGHTMGHAVEKLSNFAVPHGQAVAIGMMGITQASEAMGNCEAGSADALRAALLRCGLPTETEYDADTLAGAALADKKRQGDTITLVVPASIGKCILHPVKTEALTDIFRLGGEARA